MRGLLGIGGVIALGAAAVLLGASACAPSAATGTDAAAAPDMAAGEGRVRSSLYPADWTPGVRDAQGRFLHDVSYAGYKNGEVSPPSAPPGLIYDAVAKYGADPKGEKDSTAAIQSALDAAAGAGGGVVYLPAGLYRCDGLLDVGRSGVVLRGAGAAHSRIYFTRAQGMTDLSHVTFHGSVAAGALLPLVSDGASQSFEVRVADSSALSVGDDVSVGWVITPAFVEEHGMTGTWTVFLNQWKPFFRRQIRAIDRTVTPHRVTLDVPLRYPARLRDQAALRRETGYLSGVGIEALGVASAVAWSDAWKSMRTHVLGLSGVKDGWIRGVESFVPPTPGAETYHLQNGGLLIKDSKRVTVADTRLENAQNRGDGGCGYLFEVSTSSEVLVRDSVGRNGRHNFIQNWDFGTTGLVFLRCLTEGSRIVYSATLPLTYPAASEYHHSLTMACLVDSATIRDAWSALNRGSESSGAGHTATQDVFWNSRGSASGMVRSMQYGLGYVIGTQSVQVDTSLQGSGAAGSAPEDFVEHQDRGELLDPPSLYEDQLQRRLQRGERLW